MGAGPTEGLRQGGGFGSAFSRTSTRGALVCRLSRKLFGELVRFAFHAGPFQGLFVVRQSEDHFTASKHDYYVAHGGVAMLSDHDLVILAVARCSLHLFWHPLVADKPRLAPFAIASGGALR